MEQWTRYGKGIIEGTLSYYYESIIDESISFNLRVKLILSSSNYSEIKIISSSEVK